MPWRPLPLPKLGYPSAEEAELPSQVGARLVNVFVNEFGSIAKSPGYALFVDLGTGSSVDGLFWSTNRNTVVAVSGGKIYFVDAMGVANDKTGDALELSNPVIFAEDADKVLMANTGRMVSVDDASNSAYVADAQAPLLVSHVAYMNTRSLANVLNGTKWQYSVVNNILDYTAGGFYNADRNPDSLKALHVQDREVALFGDDSIEIWWNDGTPFSAIQGADHSEGTSATYSIQPYRGAYFLLDSDRRVALLEQRQLKNISTPIEDEIRKMSHVSDGRSMMINMGNRAYYILTFFAENRTFVFDPTVNSWMEWGAWDSANNRFNRLGFHSHTYAKGFNKHLVGGVSDGKIYHLSPDYTDHAGAEMRSVIRTAYYDHGTSNNKRCAGIRWKVKRGTGEALQEHTFMMRWRDQGRAWTNWLPVSLGKAGDNEFYVQRNKLGMYRARQYELEHTHNSGFILMGIEEDVSALRR